MMEIIDTIIVGAMGPPGGGRNSVTPRFLRHFNVLSCVEGNEAQLTHIFGSLMDWHLKRSEIPVTLHKCFLLCVEGSIEIYT